MKINAIVLISCLLSLSQVLASCRVENKQTIINQQAVQQLKPASGAVLKGTCTDLKSFSFQHTTITDVSLEKLGQLTVAKKPVPEHCLIKGYMYPRISPIDGQHYQIGFEMRLPLDWNGRYLYQGNGGIDGNITQAEGHVGSGGPITNAIYEGFAVISSDAGHSAQQNPHFGLDPQARIDYGYGAITKLTPMAKQLIKTAYGKGPDRSYAGGASNGGRHAMIAATRLANEYDGVLANAPGFHLPRAAAAQLYTAQQLRTIATDENDLRTALSISERHVLAKAILFRCDHLDGLVDGMVQDVEACRHGFNIHEHVPICLAERNGQCLTRAQIQAISNIFTGPVDVQGKSLYATQPYDPGLVGQYWEYWMFVASVSAQRGPGGIGLIFQTPPDPSSLIQPRQFAFHYNFDRDYQKMSAINDIYQESAMSFMMPPDELNLDILRYRGGKMLLVHGTADGVFSVDDTQNWYDRLVQRYAQNSSIDAHDFVRFFRVPGMNHTFGGIATDQFDALLALVRWVEYGEKPERIIATPRGQGNLGGKVNPELPADWAADRSRPLCPYPLIARYNGKGDREKAENFSCL